MTPIYKTLASLAGATLLSACQTPDAPAPAVLENLDDDTMIALRAELASITGRADVALGPGDLTENSTIAVLPPPLAPGDDRSVATPTYFDLMWIDNECVLVARETGAQYSLHGVACREF